MLFRTQDFLPGFNCAWNRHADVFVSVTWLLMSVYLFLVVDVCVSDVTKLLKSVYLLLSC